MKLYVCYGFLKNVTTTGRPGGHPCGNALKALKAAGHDPEVEAVGGLGCRCWTAPAAARRSSG